MIWNHISFALSLTRSFALSLPIYCYIIESILWNSCDKNVQSIWKQLLFHYFLLLPSNFQRLKWPNPLPSLLPNYSWLNHVLDLLLRPKRMLNILIRGQFDAISDLIVWNKVNKFQKKSLSFSHAHTHTNRSSQFSLRTERKEQQQQHHHEQ